MRVKLDLGYCQKQGRQENGDCKGLFLHCVVKIIFLRSVILLSYRNGVFLKKNRNHGTAGALRDLPPLILSTEFQHVNDW
jgi:hypothetical protein